MICFIHDHGTYQPPSRSAGCGCPDQPARPLPLPRATRRRSPPPGHLDQPPVDQPARPLAATRTMRVAGIDPGVDGAAAWVDSTGRAYVDDLPTGPHGIDPLALQDLLRAWGVHAVYLEDNRANGRNGSIA